MKTEKEMEIQLHIDKPELIQAPPVETRTYNEASAKTVNSVGDIEEEAKEQMRKEEEIYPDNQRNPSIL